jgi:integration host factor subunit beta
MKPLTEGGVDFDTQKSWYRVRGGIAGRPTLIIHHSGAPQEMPINPPTTAGKTITKKDMVERIAAGTNQPRSEVKKTIQAFLDEVIEELGRGHRLEFRDFGVFEIREQAPRRAQNPKTLEQVTIPARKTVKFKTGRLMKSRIVGPEVDGLDDQ